uniref:Uncharacterized protein n=1 Tax=Arundo donax TaxID=35708 RepID=A0A0A8Y8K3_ARUDO
MLIHVQYESFMNTG